MLGGVLGLSLIAVAGRGLAPYLDTFEMMLYRSIVGLVVVAGVLTYRRLWSQVNVRHFGLHLARNASHFTGQCLWFFALTLIPLAHLTALEFSYPLMVALAAPFVLAEKMTATRVLAAGLGFVGVMIVARPFGAEGHSIGHVAGILSAFGFAGSALATKKLTRVSTVADITFWIALMPLVFSLVITGSDGHIAVPPLSAFHWVLAIGLCGIGAHYSMTRALTLAPATVAIPVDFLRLPAMAVLGALVYHEALEVWVGVGGAIILGANWINISADSKRRRR